MTTRVSRYAKKVLRNDLPQIFKTRGGPDYLRMAYNSQRLYPGLPIKEFEHGQPVDEEESSDEVLSDDILGSRVKRACRSKTIKEHKQQKTLSYEHHIDFEDIKEGEVVGSRVLLDNQTFKKHISLNSLRFSE